MLDHIGISVADFELSKEFFAQSLAPLRYTLVAEFEHQGKRLAGFGANSKPDFWIEGGQATLPPLHVAFAATDHARVEAFYAAALEAGGKDNGAPGPRPHYHPDYYAAFVIDPDGNNIEAVCHGGEPQNSFL